MRPKCKGNGRLPWGRFVRVFFWEFVQNLPFAAGFLLGLEAWQQGQWGQAAAWMVGGSALGALAIRATEARLVEGHREPWGVVLTNAVVIAGLMLVVAVYLSAGWSAWWTDLLLGLAGGMGLGVAQDLAADSPVGRAHAVALGLGIALGLVGVRLLAASLAPGWNALLVAGIVTVFVVLVDYGPWRSSTAPQAPGSQQVAGKEDDSCL